MKEKLFRLIARTVQALDNCAKSGNTQWEARHGDTIQHLTKEFMPSGSGIDSGTQFVLDESTPNRLVFSTSYHHMNDGGFYDGWTEHRVIVTPSLTSSFDLKITGRDRNEIKDYLHEVYHSALTEEIDHDGQDYFSPRMRESVAKFQADVAAGKIT